MGSIRDLSDGKTRVLEPEHTVGRAPTAALKLPHRYVSAQHAAFRWNGVRWQLRDLGSRNGTFLDGTRLSPGEEHPVRLGSKIAFGKAADTPWEMIDESAPPVMAVPLDEGDPVVLDTDLLALPSKDNPCATIYRSPEGGWLLEYSDAPTAPIVNMQTFEVGGRVWRFCCAENAPTTALAASADLEVRSLLLSFYVSRDEEHVGLRVKHGAKSIDMGARTHNYLLLTLARRRMADAAEGLPDAACGWTYQDELAHDPTMAPPQLNVDVFRIRRQFAAAGIVDASNVVERRPGTRQLRIGTGLLSVEQV